MTVLDPKPTSNAVQAYLDRETHSGTLSVIEGPPQSPQHYEQKDPKKNFECSSRSLENHSYVYCNYCSVVATYSVTVSPVISMTHLIKAVDVR